MGVHLDGSTIVGASRLEGIEGPSGRLQRAKVERARIAAEGMLPGVAVPDVARRHGTTRWQIYDWRKQIRKGNLVVPESVAARPAYVELVVDPPAARALPSDGPPDLEIGVGDVVLHLGDDTDERQLTRAIRAARAAAS